MRVVVPYAENASLATPGLTLQTVAALDRHSPVEPEYVDVSSNPVAYHELICDLWWPREDFVVIEQDVVVHESVFRQFEECPEPWCVFPYPRGGECLIGLGCARFRKELPDIRPTMMGRRWESIDGWVSEMLKYKGFRSCEHGPWVGHVKAGVLLVH